MAARFETNVQELKYKVLKEIAKASFNGTLKDDYYDIPKIIVPGPKPTMRCCIYKERAILQERMKLAINSPKLSKNVVQVINIACDECPIGGYQVTASCRGCIAHRCQKACPKNAISFDAKTRTANIDKEKCINCGLCAKACQYNAIQNFLRPCESACKVKAISMGEDFAASINDEKCIQCGACVSTCPFGAIMDKSFILDLINLLIDSDYSRKYPLFAIVAPSIATQFKDYPLGKVISGIKQLGFSSVMEVALGAEQVAKIEAIELINKSTLTSSCCPTFVSLVKKNFPELIKYVSNSLSPMAKLGQYIKEKDSTAKVIFIGPCISKKQEAQDENVKKYVDCVITFEELQALFDARNIDLNALENSSLTDAGYFGRVFARSGGVSEAIKNEVLKLDPAFVVKPSLADGIDGCKSSLKQLLQVDSTINFIEGMGCKGGCIEGPCSLTHEVRSRLDIDKYAKEAK